MTTYPFNFDAVDSSWKECIEEALAEVDKGYLETLSQSSKWLPGPKKIFNAFSLPLEQVNYVLLGESPYPRPESANGYAFWDASVKELWSSTGLSKKVNRATSLRNILKMLLVAEKLLNLTHLSQHDIAKIDKTSLVQTNEQLFTNILKKGFLLLNATLVLQTSSRHKEAQAWSPFLQSVLNFLLKKRPKVKFILLGRIARTLDTLLDHPHLVKLCAEHPFNYSFISNTNIIAFFQPLHLLRN